MDLSKDKPAFFSDKKFSGTVFELQYYDAISLLQQWKGGDYDVTVCYHPDGSFKLAENLIRVGSLNKDSYALAYKNFVPACVQRFSGQEPAYVLSFISENLLNGTWKQLWEANSNSIDVNLDKDFVTLDYKTMQRGDRTAEIVYYRADDTVAELNHVKPFYVEKEYFYPGGQLEMRIQTANQGMPVGLMEQFDEGGSLTASHDFDAVPHHRFGFHKTLEKLEEQNIDLDGCTVELKWLVKDWNGLRKAEVNGESGELFVEPPPPEPIEQLAEAPAKSYYEFIKDLVGEESIFTEDSECIFGPQSYVDLLEELKKLTGASVQWEFFEIKKDQEFYSAFLKINGRSRSFILDANTDHFDGNLVLNINLCLKDSGSKSTFYSLHDEQWGQEMAFIFIKEALAECIIARIRTYQPAYIWGDLDNFIGINSSGVIPQWVSSQ